MRSLLIAAALTLALSGAALAQETTTDTSGGDTVEVDSSSLREMLEALLLQEGIEIIQGNIEASRRESGELDKAIRAVLGVSIKDIKEYGLLGGPNSEMRKLFKALGLD